MSYMSFSFRAVAQRRRHTVTVAEPKVSGDSKNVIPPAIFGVTVPGSTLKVTPGVWEAAQ